MKVVWARGEVTTDDVQEALRQEGRDLADGSVRKVLSILVAKGYLARRRQGRAFVYHATVREDEASRSMVQDLLRRAFDGSAALLVASLLDSRTVRPKDLQAIKRLIAEHEEEGKP